MAAKRKRVLFGSPWWHTDIVNGVIRNGAKLGWHIDLQTCLSGDLPRSWDGDGIITQLGGDLADQKRLLQDSGCPAVSLNANHPEIDIPCVSTDGTAAGRLAADHLTERGFRSYAFYASGHNPSRSSRFNAFQRALVASGHRVETLAWRDTDPGQDWAAHHGQLRERLRSLDKPVGLFAFNDQAAVEVIEACLAESIDVPDQVAVLGMLDMDIFRHSTTIALSSICFDFDRITNTACELLDRMMRGRTVSSDPILIPPTGIAVRQSTDTLAAHSPPVARSVRFMLDQYAEPIGVGQIVEASGVSRAGLFKAFKQDMGRAPGEVLMGIRIDRAKRMLQSTDQKVYAVADACGFGKPVNLHRAFAQHVGMSPNAYRKAARAGAA
jgi:LacI family transcriptional regulator